MRIRVFNIHRAARRKEPELVRICIFLVCCFHFAFLLGLKQSAPSALHIVDIYFFSFWIPTLEQKQKQQKKKKTVRIKDYNDEDDGWWRVAL